MTVKDLLQTIYNTDIEIKWSYNGRQLFELKTILQYEDRKIRRIDINQGVMVIII